MPTRLGPAIKLARQFRLDIGFEHREDFRVDIGVMVHHARRLRIRGYLVNLNHWIVISIITRYTPLIPPRLKIAVVNIIIAVILKPPGALEYRLKTKADNDAPAALFDAFQPRAQSPLHLALSPAKTRIPRRFDLAGVDRHAAMHTVGDTTTGQRTVRTAHVNVGRIDPAKGRHLVIRRAINRG